MILLSSALIVGLMHSLPMIYVRCRLGSEYKGIFPLQSADEEHYDVSIKTAMDGYYHHKNNYLFEGRDVRKGGVPPFFSEKILGYIGGKLNLSLSCWILVMRFLFPALAFLMMYGLFRSVNVSRYQALFWSFFNLLTPYLLYGWFDIVARPFFRVLSDNGWKALWYEQYAIANLPWARTVNPQFSGLFFLPALICLVKIIRGRKTWLWLILFLILGYVNFRLYFYFWSCLGALMAVAFVFSFLYRKRRILYPLGAVLLLGLIYGHSWVISLIFTPGSGINSHLPVISPGCVVAFLLILIGIIRSGKGSLASTDMILFFMMPIGVLVCMNQNILTGKIVQPWHYELFITPLLLSIALSILINREDVLNRICESMKRKLYQNHRLFLVVSVSLFLLLFIAGTILFFYYFKLSPNFKDAMFYIITGALGFLCLVIYFRIFLYLVVFTSLPVKRLVYYLGLGLLLLIFIQGLTRQAYISVRLKRRAVTNQYLAAPFRWLRENTPPDTTVLASFDVSERIPLYTHNAIYLCKNAYHEVIKSPEDRRERALNYFILTGYNLDSFRSVLAVWPYGYLFWRFQKIQAQKDLYSFTGENRVPDDVLNQVLGRFEEKSKNDITNIMNEYPLDFIFWGPEEQKFFKSPPANLPYLSKVYEDKTPVIIYKFDKISQ